MNTVKKIIKNPLPEPVLYELRKQGICNGMGGSGGFKFTPWIEANLPFFPWFEQGKAKQYLKDLDLVSDYHDISFWEGNTVFKFVISNFILAYRIYKLSHWTSIKYRILIFLGVFLATCFQGKKYYNWGIKNNLKKYGI